MCWRRRNHLLRSESPLRDGLGLIPSMVHLLSILALISMHLYPAQTLQLASKLETQAEIFLTLLIKLICGETNANATQLEWIRVLVVEIMRGPGSLADPEGGGAWR